MVLNVIACIASQAVSRGITRLTVGVDLCAKPFGVEIVEV